MILRIEIENKIDLIPIIKRYKKSKYFECKWLFLKIISENII